MKTRQKLALLIAVPLLTLAFLVAHSLKQFGKLRNQAETMTHVIAPSFLTLAHFSHENTEISELIVDVSPRPKLSEEKKRETREQFSKGRVPYDQ